MITAYNQEKLDRAKRYKDTQLIDLSKISVLIELRYYR